MVKFCFGNIKLLPPKGIITDVDFVQCGQRFFRGKVFFTRDTHFDNYMDTQEGKNLPVPHCIKGTDGWQIHPSLDALRKTEAIDKITFGSTELVEVLAREKDIELAVTAAVWVHSAAGDMAAKRLSQTSMLPSDMIDELPCLFKKLEG